jgi:hypothetical protein
MAAIFAGTIAAALGSAFVIAAIAAAWLQLGPNRKRAQAQTWLLQEGIDSSLRTALKPVLMDMWKDAWGAGHESAVTVSGLSFAVGFNANDFMERWGRQWLNEVVQTRLNDLARILSEGPDDLPGLIRELRSYLRNEESAHLIAVTEITRAVNIAAGEAYRHAGIFEVRWQTEDANACPLCIANERAGSRQLGMPFPSGATAPPQHPRCRCALLPA